MSERRIFARHTPTALTYVSAGNANGGILLNISEAGCALQLISPPPANAEVELDLDLGSNLPRVEAAGKVAWTDDTGCTGIRFVRLADPARAVIRKFIASTPSDAPLADIGLELESVLGQPAAEHAEDPLKAPANEEVLFDSVEPESLETRLQELSTGAAFVALVEECRTATGASAAALALLKGREMLCRASCGNGAPPSGAKLDISSERSFTAQCVATATTLRCVDSQIDPRVNAAVCKKLGIRSVTAMPLAHDGNIVGVLEVFSPERNAFHDGHVAALEAIGNTAVTFAVSRNEVTLPESGEKSSWSMPPRQEPRAPERPVTTTWSPAAQFGTTAAAAVAVAPARIAAQPAAAAAAAPAPVLPKVEAPRVEVPQVEAPAAKTEVAPPAVEAPAARPAEAAKVAATAAFMPSAVEAAKSAAATSQPVIEAPLPKPPEAKPAAMAEPPKAAAASVAPIFSPVERKPMVESKPVAPVKPAEKESTKAAPLSATSITAKPAPAKIEVSAPAKEAAKPAARTNEAAAAAARAKAEPAKSDKKQAEKKQREGKLQVAPLAEDPMPAAARTPDVFTAYDRVQTEQAPAAKRNMPILAAVAAAIVLAAGGIGGWMYHRAHASAQPTQPASTAATTPATNDTAAAAPAPPATSAATSTSGTTGSSAKPGAATPTSQPASAKSDSSKATTSQANKEAKPGQPGKAEQGKSTQQQVIALAQSSGTPRTQQTSNVVAPPTINTGSTSIAAMIGRNAATPTVTLSAPPAAPAAPAAPLRVSSEALKDSMLRRVEPVYPQIALRTGIGGAVRLRLLVGADGKVKSATVVDGIPMLAEAAKQAVLLWRYKPYLVDGKPSSIETEVVVRFTPAR